MKYYFVKNSRAFKSTFLRFFYLASIYTLFSFSYSCNTFERSSVSLDYLNNPLIGDIYFLEKENGNYTLLKVKDIGADSISFFKNKAQIGPEAYIDASISSRKLDILNNSRLDTNWTDSIQVISKDKIHSLYEKELIFEIKRN